MPTETTEQALAELRSELNRAFDYWNARHWSGRLPKPFIVFHPSGPNGRHKIGHFVAAQWEPTDARRRQQDELMFVSDLCFQVGTECVFETLLHEMVHVWQAYFGDPKNKPKSAWHNYEWHEEAQRVGFLTKPGDGTGLSLSTPALRLDLAEFAPSVRRLFVRSRRGRPGKLLRWQCDCGYGVRVAVAYFNAHCLDCGSRFRQQDAPKEKRRRLVSR